MDSLLVSTHQSVSNNQGWGAHTMQITIQETFVQWKRVMSLGEEMRDKEARYE